jgi:anti-sigma-K factor RskA
MPEQPRHFDDLSELLSAYLDGELTAEEQALVEQRLGESAEFRQLHDELRSLRSSLETLPRHKLGPDFTEAVLRRAERAMLATPALKPALPQSAEPVARADAPTAQERILRGLRAFRWSIVAIAVALLIMVFNHEKQQKEPNVALLQKDAADSDQARMKNSGDGEMIAMPLNKQRDETTSLPAASAPAEKAMLKANAHDLSYDQHKADEAIEAPAAENLDGKSAATMSADSLADQESPSGQREGAGRGFGGRKSDTAKSQRFSAPRPENFALEESDRQQAAQRALSRQLALPGDVLIVQCEISPQALKSHAFEQLLAEQQIDLVASESSAGFRDDQKANEYGADHAAARKRSSELNAARQELSKEVADRSGEKTEARASAANAFEPPLEAFFVEASPEQISAMLAELQSRGDEFRALNLPPPAANAAVRQSAEESAATQRGRAIRLANESPKLKEMLPQALAKERADGLAAKPATPTGQSESKAGAPASQRVLFLLRVVPPAEPSR